jgi:hypothetical protein
MNEKPKLYNDNHPYRVSAEEIMQELNVQTGISITDTETADKIVAILDSNIKAYRHLNYEKYRNQRVTVEVGGLLVDCFVHDIKVVDGMVQYQVKPVAGEKAIWVSRFAETK